MSALRLPLGDILCPGALMAIGTYFAAHPEVDVVMGWNLVFRKPFDTSTGSAPRKLREQQAGSGAKIIYVHEALGLHLEYLLYSNYFLPQESTFWRRRVYERIGELDLNLYVLDHDYFIRMALIGAHYATLRRPIGGFRKHNKHCASRTLGVENSQSSDCTAKPTTYSSQVLG